MTVKSRLSNSFKAKQSRIKRLPKLLNGAIFGAVKRDLINIEIIFHDGIRDNTLGLFPLVYETILGKISKGYSEPDSPLYGEGDDAGERSYSNMLNITKLKNGWKLSPSKKMHHSGKITLKGLFDIHEYGAIAKRTKANGETTLIRIPPRPALLLAYRQWLQHRKKDKRETSKEVKKAMQEFIDKGKEKGLKILDNFNKREK